MKECTTHHYACDCREAAFKKLVDCIKLIEFQATRGFPTWQEWTYLEIQAKQALKQYEDSRGDSKVE